MKVIFLQNTIYDGRRYPAGEAADVDDTTAKKMIDASLAYADKVIVETPKAEVAPVKLPNKKAARKAAQK